MSRIKALYDLAKFAFKRPKLDRNTESVTEEYSDGWNALRTKLDKSTTIEDWLSDNTGKKGMYNVNGKLSYTTFDYSDFYRRTFLKGFEKNFPNALSVAEFGCGVGRNLIYLHLNHPHLKLYGFELCAPGVELANAAAKKFNLPIQYFQLDYLNWLPKDIKMPNIDVGFTIFSLEQIPLENRKALSNIMSKVNMGTFHLEPVAENYPITLRGYIARVDHDKVGYLRNFEKNAKLVVGNKNVTKKVFNSGHSPLMYPSLYILKKS
jgi:SAM-dependent methyltransferase